MSTYTVTLNGPAPWGFRLQGGKDFNMPLTISRITPGSKAAGGSLAQGDIISAIDGVSTDGMTHLEAQNKIKCATSQLALTMHKSRRPAPVPTATPRMDSPMPVIPHQKELKEEVHMGETGDKIPSKRNLFQVPKKDPEIPPASPTQLSTPVKRPASLTPAPGSPGGQLGQYNSPIGLYSQETLREMMLMQGKLREGSAATQGLSVMGGALPIKDPVVDCASPVYQAVIRPGESSQEMSEWARRAANLQSKSFRILAHITGTEYLQDPDEEALQRSREKFESEVKGPRFAKLKNWHQGLSSQILNIQE
ncbi:LIM domain-binding protein 3b isoform X1 [Thunnus albacares]|uniref:LIM domain-binding protein 3b isoform X1 n=1 Tax=Thunnus albacares TaxID=8236 RepID=UPI001CF71C4B|nr:LIM domain-binding protein 3b isoform X1 [Thunnus albacares]